MAVTIRLFGALDVTVTESDWDYLCSRRFFSDNPPADEVEAEFISGTGITPKKTSEWKDASERFGRYISDLREISRL